MSMPAPDVELFNPQGRLPALILCDHAGRRVPARLGTLGISQEALRRHIGWDIGAADLTRGLAQRLDAPAILNHVSRLVVDANRRPLTPASMPAVSDGCVVPANQSLGRAEIDRRLREHFFPYHRAIATQIGRMRRAGRVPVIIAVHSFTPRMNGEDRPWQVGVLWRGDQRLALPLLARLRRRGDLVVGDNQPYSGLTDFGFTVTFHAQRPRLPHVMLEIRQDEIASPQAAAAWAELLADALAGPLQEPSLWRPFTGDNRPPDAPWSGWRHAGGVDLRP